MIKIAPSVLAADFSSLGKCINEVEVGGADYLHLDVMDGVFVPNISFGIPVIKSIRKQSGMFFDVHLMITEPIRYIKDFANSGADLITVHFESCSDIEKTLDAIHNEHKKAGVSVKPSTDVEVLIPYLDKIDLILIMTVEPGFGGQKFITSSPSKISAAKDIINASGRTIELEVDGGINSETAALCAANGANVLVAGSSVFGKSNIPAAISDIRSAAEQSQS